MCALNSAHPFLPLIPAQAGIQRDVAYYINPEYVPYMFFVYILANNRNGTLYLGHTDNLGERVLQHKVKANSGFSSKHNCCKLVWFETHETRESAFRRERQMKKWNRAWKIRRIETDNPDWLDLYDGLTVDQVYHPRHQYQAAKL